MKVHKPTLSVLISNYNHGLYLPTALDAILSQSYKPKEIIIIDDASTDNSFEILKSYAEKSDIIQLNRNEKNLGIFVNTNLLLKYATSDYVYSASSDDEILPGFFERSMNMLSDYPEAGLCTALVSYCDENGKYIGKAEYKRLGKIPIHLSKNNTFDILTTRDLPLFGNTCIFKKDALMEFNGYSDELGPFSDLFLMLTISLKYGMCFIPEHLGCRRIMGTCFSQSSREDIEYNVNILNRAIELMEKQYGNIYPDIYVKYFKNLYVYGIVASQCDKMYRGQLKYLEELEMLYVRYELVNKISKYCILIMTKIFSWSTKIMKNGLLISLMLNKIWLIRRYNRLKQYMFPSV